MRTIALILAAGRGVRVGEGSPKQYRLIAGQPLLRRAIAAFALHPSIDRVQVVIHADDQELYREAAASFDLLPPVIGGPSRQESARLGLERLAPLKPSKVLIHDAARPFVSASLIQRVIARLAQSPGAIPALPVADTLKRASDGNAQQGPDRSDLWLAQTPQGFRFPEILAAHQKLKGRQFGDDAAVAEAAGLDVALVLGDDNNFKVTTSADLRRAEVMMAAALIEIRVGQGLDVHAFAAAKERPLLICGVEVAHDKSLIGHSDADVGLHAVTDAILGAVADGDIGQHFPPTEARWRKASSTEFLRFAASRVVARGGVIAHVDVTVICERPKIAPYRAAMRTRLAALLGLTVEQVSIKATTTEHLGFTGRGEGMAAQAVATIRLPPANLSNHPSRNGQ
jgi:2-C-methyl-D-erythritol 4-phosphate cytidylyltransferase/2-C-methyl-D-erythritol 2,4-cyclodiphosphate synthase